MPRSASFSPNPFVGPAPLPRNKKIYGRKAEVRELFYRLVAERIVWLYSPSGAGKTSLVQAQEGLLSRLEDDGFEVWPSARVGNIDGIVGPTRDEAATLPNRYVMSVLLSLEEDLIDDEKTAQEKLKTFTLHEYITERKERFEPSESVVLLFDQFEEILTSDPLDIGVKQEFFHQVGEALRDPDLWALFILREEYLAALDPYLSAIPTRMKNKFRLDLMGLEAAREAISSTAEDGGRVFAEEAAKRLVADLARMKVQRVDGSFVEKIGRHVEPVQLQVVCHRLWERMPAGDQSIDPEDMERFGDVTEALVAYYQDSIQEIAGGRNAREHAIREWFGKRLILSGIRRQVLHGCESSEGLANDMVEKLLGTYLIRAEQRAGATWYELVHDRLIEPILESNRKRRFKLRRQRLVTAFLATVLLTTLGLTWNFDRIRDNRGARAERMSQLALDILKDHPPRSLWLALQAAKVAQTADRRLTPRNRDALRLALQGSHAKLVRSLPIGDIDYHFTLSRHGNRLSILDPADPADPIEPNGRTWVWDVKSGRELLSLQSSEDSIIASALNPDGTTLVAALDDGRLQLWDVDSRQLVRAFPANVEVFELLFSPDGSRFAATSFEGTVELWDALTGQSVASLSDPVGPIFACAFGPESKRLATLSEAGRIMIHGLGPGMPMSLHQNPDAWHATPLGPITFPSGDDSALSFSPSGFMLASGGSNGVSVWDTTTGMLPGLWHPEESEVYSIAFGRGDKYVVSALNDGTARIWDSEVNLRRTALPGAPDLNVRPEFSQDGSRLAISREQGKTEVWQLIFAEVPRILSGHCGRVNAVAASRQSGLLASGSDDQTARLWDLESGQTLETLSGHEGAVNAVAFSPDGRRLATASDDHTARIWDLESGRLERTLAGHSSTVTAVAWSTDGLSIATGSTDATARVWNVIDGIARRILPHPGESVRAVAFSPDSDSLATAGGKEDAGTTRIWDVGSGREAARFADHAGLVNAVAFSPNGNLLATGSDDKTARIWAIASSKLLVPPLSGHLGTVTGVAFTADGKGLATSDVNGTVHFWNVDSGNRNFTIPAASPIWDLTFTLGGRHLITGSNDSRIRLEPLSAEDLIHLAEGRTGDEPVLQVEN